MAEAVGRPLRLSFLLGLHGLGSFGALRCPGASDDAAQPLSLAAKVPLVLVPGRRQVLVAVIERWCGGLRATNRLLVAAPVLLLFAPVVVDVVALEVTVELLAGHVLVGAAVGPVLVGPHLLPAVARTQAAGEGFRHMNLRAAARVSCAAPVLLCLIPLLFPLGELCRAVEGQGRLGACTALLLLDAAVSALGHGPLAHRLKATVVGVAGRVIVLAAPGLLGHGPCLEGARRFACFAMELLAGDALVVAAPLLLVALPAGPLVGILLAVEGAALLVVLTTPLLLLRRPGARRLGDIDSRGNGFGGGSRGPSRGSGHRGGRGRGRPGRGSGCGGGCGGPCRCRL
mmetsp:Transcript_15359/g.36164  ORF Transcript_15359/g.36164 Transcript_15359/m.36164 type:complete len:343 (-) Transcript_15359:1021-2049(-)